MSNFNKLWRRSKAYLQVYRCRVNQKTHPGRIQIKKKNGENESKEWKYEPEYFSLFSTKEGITINIPVTIFVHMPNWLQMDI